MPLKRQLEPEVMDSAEEAADYDSMDHAEVNRVFVSDLLTALDAQFAMQNAECGVEAETSHSEFRTPHLDVLDLGTGTALIPIELCKKLTDCRVMAADAAVSMLELARYNIEVNGLIDRIELAQVDAKRLPFADGMFDIVMSNSIVHHIPEPIHALREAVRVTKLGGFMFFRDLLRPDTEQQLRQLVEIYAHGANQQQRQMFDDSLHAALSLDEVRGLVVSLGLSADDVQQTSDRHWTLCASKSAV